MYWSQQRGPDPRCSTSHLGQFIDLWQEAPSLQTLPTLAPRADYIQLLFTKDPSVDVKLSWLSEVTRAFHRDRDLVEVETGAITSRFVYIFSRRSNIFDSVTRGEFLYLSQEIQDSPERPRKLPKYLLTRYPVCNDPIFPRSCRAFTMSVDSTRMGHAATS